MWRAANAAKFVPKFWPRSCAETDGSNVTPLSDESITRWETPSRRATCLNEASHSLNPSALSPQSAARAEAIPSAATAAMKSAVFKLVSRIPALPNLVADFKKVAERQTRPNVGGQDSSFVIDTGERLVGGPCAVAPAQFRLCIRIFLRASLRQILNRLAYCRGNCVTCV